VALTGSSAFRFSFLSRNERQNNHPLIQMGERSK
jgi:hypothetical protein